MVEYVKSSNLVSSFSTLEEVIDYQNSVKSGYTSISLYKQDGKTVVGKFRQYYSKRE